MTKGNKVQPTVDELVATLRNSALPTLLVEGKSDMTLFQSFEEECFAGEVDIFPIYGRPRLLKLYARRQEYEHAAVAFLADADMFAFTPPPVEYAGIVFTEGYSIENDILSGGKALKLVSKKHRPAWEKILDSLAHWFASIVHRSLAGEILKYSAHPNQIVHYGTGEVKPSIQKILVNRMDLCSPSVVVLTSPVYFLRGHTLIDGLSYFLVETKNALKYSKGQLLNIDLLSWETNPALNRIVTEVQKTLQSRPK